MSVRELAPGKWALETAGRRLVVEATRGARVVEWSIGGRNVLTGPDVNADNFGATFWTSPQSDWGWPPPAEIDTDAFDASVRGGQLVLEGPTSGALGLSVAKRWSCVAPAAFRVVYSVSNRGQNIRRVAPWEVTRVAGGLSFFPAGEGVYEPGPAVPLQVTQRDGIVWFDHAAWTPDSDRKLFSHATGGWLGHAFDDVLLVKRFAPVPAASQAPGEAHVEIFANGDGSYVELEPQGEWSELQPGGRIDWTVTWLLEPIPEGTSVAVGSSRLVEFASALP